MTQKKKMSLKFIIFLLIELILFLFQTIHSVLKSIVPALVFGMFFIIQGIEITSEVSFLILMALIGGLLKEFRK